ncbi:MAG: DUF6489 family protein [Pacificimonas sp.]
MNVKLNIDCTPQEARAFFGLPDLSPVHDAYVARMSRYAEEGLSQEDMQRAMSQWMGGMSALSDQGMAGFRTMMAAMGGAAGKE